MEKLFLFTFGVAVPLVGILFLGIWFGGLWYFFVYLQAPVPADELASLSAETLDALGSHDREKPITRGELAEARGKLKRMATLAEQRRAIDAAQEIVP